METLSQKQQRFALFFSRLVAYIYQSGYACTYAEARRSDEQAEINALSHEERQKASSLLSGDFPGLSHAIAVSTSVGIRASVHRLGLAVDVNLFKDGVFQTTKEAYAIFGDWWKKQQPDACWGGDWGDSDHFSFTHAGVK